MDPQAPVPIPARAAARMGRATKLVERMDRSAYNQTRLPATPPRAGEKPHWVMRVTGEPASGLPGLYRGEILLFSYAPATGPVWQPSPDLLECWAVPLPGSLLNVGDEGEAVCVGEYDGGEGPRPVFALVAVANYGGSGGGSRSFTIAVPKAIRCGLDGQIGWDLEYYTQTINADGTVSQEVL